MGVVLDDGISRLFPVDGSLVALRFQGSVGTQENLFLLQRAER